MAAQNAALQKPFLQAQRSRTDGRTAFSPDFLEAAAIGHNLFRLVDQQLAARLIPVEANQRMAAVHKDHRISQMAELFRGLLHRRIVTVGGQQLLKQWLALLLERLAVAHSDAQAVVGRCRERALQHFDTLRIIEMKHAEILVVDPDSPGG